jgi:hypothetical protein
MKKNQLAAGTHQASAGGPRFLRRLRDLLADGFRPPQLVPVPIAAGSGSRGPLRRPEPEELPLHRVFGRRRDEDKDQGSAVPADQTGSEAAEDQGDGGPEEPVSAGGENLPQEFTEQIEPVPSPLTDDERSEVDPGLGSSPVGSSWSTTVPEDPKTEPSPFAFEPAGEQQDLPAWTPSPLSQAGFPSFGAGSGDDAPALSPWAGDVDADVSPFGQASVPQEVAGEEADGWPETAEPTPPWAASGQPAAADAGFGEAHFGEVPAADQEPVLDEPWAQTSATPADLVGEPEAPSQAAEASEDLLEVEAPTETFEAYEPDAEVSAVSQASWEITAPEPVAEPAPIYHFEEPSPHVGAAALVADARAFPLPEGDVLFRNLRSGFTDPARLLRHLAGEGHTGVMHVASLDDRNSYIVLVDGYVVAVASDSQGRLTTTNRVSFPSFPNSQDILNVITYPREIARGLGLLLHAPVHFRGLGAMFINMDGLRSYLSKRSACGGLVVQSDAGTGVALFDDGRLVGAYCGNTAPESDLAPLRDLIKDLDAEIDVRFGGPQSLDPIPLDTLLAGYPL